MEVHQVQGAHSKVSQAALELGLEEGDRRAVHFSSDLVGLENPRLHELSMKVCPDVHRKFSVVGDVAVLRGEEYFLPLHDPLPSQPLERSAYRPLASLRPVVYRRVDDVNHARFQRSEDGLLHELVCVRVRVPKIRSDPERPEAQRFECPEVRLQGALPFDRSFGELLRSF